MAFWRKTDSTPDLPPIPPRLAQYICNYDGCENSLVGEVAAKLAYGCYLCAPPKSPPTRYDDLPPGLRELIPVGNISLLWRNPIPCPQHQRDIRPYCPLCYCRIDQHGNIPPVGIYGFSYAGKTVFCAVLMMELEKLFGMTGILKEQLFDEGEYLKGVVDPLRRKGIVPAKTLIAEHRSLTLKLYRDDWFRKKVTLNDMGGENYEELGRARPADEQRRRMLDHLLHVKDAIFLMSPESARGLGASVSQDLYPVVTRVMEVFKVRNCLWQDDRNWLEELLKKVIEVVTRFKYLFGGGGEGLRPVAEGLVALVRDGDTEDLIDFLEEELMKVDDQLVVRPLENQLDALIGFLRGDSSPGLDGKLNQRLALTIGKVDLLENAFNGDETNANAQKSLNAWRASTERLKALGPTNSKKEWHKALKRTSDAVRQILIDFGEERFVAQAERNFREVGFFFISSLGRDTEPFFEWTRRQQQVPAQGYRAIGGMPTSIPSATRVAEWKVAKRVQLNHAGVREPDPQHVLWPLLWMLTAN